MGEIRPSDRSGLTAVAGDVLETARNRLLVNLRYLDTALTFHERAVYDGTISTDGKALYFDPVFVLRRYTESREELIRAYLHTVMHCIFIHPFAGAGIDRDCWDLACDIAVECTINELGIPWLMTGRTERQVRAASAIRKAAGFLTAEKVYRALIRCRDGAVPPGGTLSELSAMFASDDHSMWRGRQAERIQEVMSGEPPDAGDIGPEDSWKQIAEKIELELETFARIKGRYSSALVQNLRAVNRERYDYEEFLRKFAAANETVRVSDDEFDYIYYHYGLTHYRNMPLIEPLEYREDRKIRDFVIAIDTSGSVAGQQVQAFLQKTYNILRQRESFHTRVCVHIIQCDAEIQNDSVITCPEDFDRYMETMEIKGLGGTDFRPVFSYVDGLRDAGQISDLKGLIYFTDGLGTYPAEKPSYKTAFVFVENGYDIPEVPVWAMKVILDSDELEKGAAK